MGWSEGEDWTPKDDDGNEDVPEEWESDDEQLPDAEEDPITDDTQDHDDEMDVDDQVDIEYLAFIETFRKKGIDRAKDEWISFETPSDIGPLDKFRDEPQGHFEHVAGPGCSRYNGYKGHIIQASEMYGCKTIQCLVPKPPNWRPEPDDMDFERQSRFFLSGLSDHMPSRDMDRPQFQPQRNGLEWAEAEVHDYLVGHSNRSNSISDIRIG